MEEIGIYVHIPFCARKCNYCDFISYENKEEKIEQYIKALINEINTIGIATKKSIKITTIYIGGGTPSFIESKYISSILEAIRNNYIVSDNAEITIELNPGTVTSNKLKDYKLCGINRLSIGLQSTDNNLLKKIGRIHTYEQFLDTYNLARKIGFENINIDLMLALPGQTINILADSLERIINLKPEHVSVYSLILEEGTKLYNQVKKGELKLLDDDLERKMYWNVKNKLEQKGYKHYEISNFALNGYESKHNLNCWNQEQYLGFGLAAHSYYRKTRYSNTENIDEYIKAFYLENINNIVKIHEKQEQLDEQKEYMMLGLRKIDGISISSFKNKFIKNPIYIFHKELDELIKEDLIQIDGNYIKLTNKGLDLANLVWEKFV